MRIIFFLFCLINTSSFGQSNKFISFSEKKDSSKKWRRELPIEAGIYTLKKEAYACLIINTKDSVITTLGLIANLDSLIKHQKEFYDKLLKLEKDEMQIVNDKSLSQEEKRKRLIQLRLGIIYKDTISFKYSEIKEIKFFNNGYSKKEFTLSLVSTGFSGLVFMTGFVGILIPRDSVPSDNFRPLAPALLLVGIGGVIASSIWTNHILYTFIKTRKWNLEIEEN